MEGWVGLAWLVGYILKWNWIEPDAVTHLSTNRVRRRLTSLIKANVLTTMPSGHLPQKFSRNVLPSEIFPRDNSTGPANLLRCQLSVRSRGLFVLVIHWWFNQFPPVPLFSGNFHCLVPELGWATFIKLCGSTVRFQTGYSVSKLGRQRAKNDAKLEYLVLFLLKLAKG